MRDGGMNWVARAPGEIERIEACFSGRAFAAHRHDSYAIGITLAGVQSFDYRGRARHSRPGQVVVLHPDEVHDGRAGDGGIFRYRTAYVAPALLQDVLEGRPLPFVPGGISDDRRLKRAVVALLGDFARPHEAPEREDVICDLADALEAIAGRGQALSPVNRAAALRARAYIDSRLEHGVTLAELERETRHRRWQLSRDFRALFGTSPYRYLVARRLDKARRLMSAGHSASAAAHACGFADQSHFGRAFRKAYGTTPHAWAAPHDRSIRRPDTRAS